MSYQSRLSSLQKLNVNQKEYDMKENITYVKNLNCELGYK
jgi:hypothetical protein